MEIGVSLVDSKKKKEKSILIVLLLLLGGGGGGGECEGRKKPSSLTISPVGSSRNPLAGCTVYSTDTEGP